MSWMDTNNYSVKATYKEFDAPWHGDSKIVVGIDIGTTFSGAAFTFLQKGVRQELCKVDQWPGQQSQCSDGKIPSIVYYDLQGKAKLFGAEALTYEAEMDADHYGWKLVKHFKLHMHPRDLRTKYRLKLDDLPTGVSVERIYSDFLKYMLRQIKPCFWRMYGGGPELWEIYRPDAVFIIAHPNGWGSLEQSRIRRAAVSAGLTTTNKAVDHIRFVPEAEASVHFGLYYTNLKTCLRPESIFAVCDAGGSTVDTTLYSVEEVYPRFKVGEVSGSACVQAGAIFVNEHLKVHLRRSFENASMSQEEVDDRTNQGINDFESQEKRRFSEQSVRSQVHIRVGDSRYKVPSLGIKFGRLSLSGMVVRSFFDVCVNDILASVSSLTALTSVSYVLLVGGFAGNPYLRQRLQAQLNLIHQPAGCQVIITNEPGSKAVAEGALIWYCANSVVKRAPRFAYGIHIRVPFDPTNPEHSGRKQRQTVSGTYVSGAWSEIVAKDVPVDCDSINRSAYEQEYTSPRPDLGSIRTDIYGYKYAGLSSWMTSKSGVAHEGFQKICLVEADLSGLRGALKAHTNASGVPYWTLDFNICIRFGRTELEAYMEWQEGMVTKSGPVTMLPISDVEKD